MKKTILAKSFTCILAAAAFLACSQAEPEIKFSSLQLVTYENGGSHVERFSFFVLPSDEDGIEDLGELRLYHDWEGLSWKITSSDWIEENLNGQTWIGSRSIAMEDGSELPRGQFRAVLIDKGGEKTEKLITFDAPGTATFPNITITGNQYRIVSEFPQNNIIAYDNTGNYLLTVQARVTDGDITTLGLPSQAKSVCLWAYDPERSVSAFTDIVPLGE
jgi:hypothetical protein